MVQVLEKENIEQLFDKYIIIVPEKEKKQRKEIKKKLLRRRKKNIKVVKDFKNQVDINALKAKAYSNIYQNRLKMF